MKLSRIMISHIEAIVGEINSYQLEEIEKKYIIATPYSAVFLDEDRNPSKPFNTLPHWLGSCK